MIGPPLLSLPSSLRAESKGGPIIFYLALLSLLFGASGALAQDKPDSSALPKISSETLTLTLDKAVSLALKQNPTAQIAVLQAADAVQDTNLARPGLCPHADLQT